MIFYPVALCASASYRVAVNATALSVKPTLTGELVTLVPMTAEHSPALLEAMNDPGVLRFTGSTAPIDPEHGRKWAATRAETTDRLDLVIVDNASGAFVGEVVFNEWDEDNRSCQFRILIGPAGQGRGLGTEATRLIVGYGFEVLGMHRIHLGVYDYNPRAQRAYEKVGFVREGVNRDELFLDGEWHDSINMSILEDEWANHRGRP